MYPIYNIQGIENEEKKIEEKHVVMLLIVKPQDRNANEIISRINYWHWLSGRYCNIYLTGYSKSFLGKYPDAKIINGTNNERWEYSDICFIEARKSLENRLKNWQYSGSSELIVLQNNPSSQNPLDFSGCCCIDIEYGLKHEYIDSIPRFMEKLIRSCESEVTASDAFMAVNKKGINLQRVIEFGIENCNKLPEFAKEILKNRLFLKKYK